MGFSLIITPIEYFGKNVFDLESTMSQFKVNSVYITNEFKTKFHQDFRSRAKIDTKDMCKSPPVCPIFVNNFDLHLFV